MFKKFLVPLILVLLMVSSAFGQFGRNKIQYVDFNWQVITTEHFSIYFYPEEEIVASIAADFAEESFAFLKEKFQHTPTKKIPFIVYCNPNHFQQTNVIHQLLPEGVGGFFEFMKGRVVIPFNGSVADFQRVIQHELVHVFSVDLKLHLRKVNKKRYICYPPLWFEEGLAEYWSQGWTSRAEAIVREMVVSGHIITFPELPKISGSFLMYKVGQNIIKFLIETYGEEKFVELLKSQADNRKFSKLILKVYGKSFYSIGDEWANSLKKKYYPEYKTKELPSVFAKQITTGGINVEPTVTDSGTIVYKHVSKGYIELKINDETIIKDRRNEKFESLHLLTSKIDARGDFLVFSVKSGEADQLCVYQISTQQVIFKKSIPPTSSIRSPSFVTNSIIVFSGTQSDGFSDLYLVDITTDVVQQLTNDIYLDADPVGASQHDYIAFSSDRAFPHTGQNIFLYDVYTATITQITRGDFHDKFPTWGHEGNKLAFTSNRLGSQDLYLIPDVFADTLETHQITNSVSEIMHPSFTPDDSVIVFTGYEKFSYQLYGVEIPSDTVVTVMYDSSAAQIFPRWVYQLDLHESKKYEKKYSIDIAKTAFGYDTYYGGAGGLQFAVSDVLGDDYFHFLIYNNSSRLSGFLDGFNFVVAHYNLKPRLNVGWGVFRFSNYYYNRIYGPLKCKDHGIFGSFWYPFSKFTRLELTTQLRHTQKTSLFNYKPEALVHDIKISYVKDNSIWTYTGPVDGQRFKMTVRYSYDVTKMRSWTTTCIVDFRNYYRMWSTLTLATRVVGFKSVGIDPDRIYMGGSWDLRGYPFKYFYGKNALLLSNELRFPFVDNVGCNVGPIRLYFTAIETAIFLDVGKAWEYNRDPIFGSYGFGFRVPFGGVGVLKFDFVKRFDASNRRLLSDKFELKFGFGYDF